MIIKILSEISALELICRFLPFWVFPDVKISITTSTEVIHLPAN